MYHITIELDDDRFGDIPPDEISEMIKHDILHSAWDINHESFLNLTVKVRSSGKERIEIADISPKEAKDMLDEEMGKIMSALGK